MLLNVLVPKQGSLASKTIYARSAVVSARPQEVISEGMGYADTVCRVYFEGDIYQNGRTPYTEKLVIAAGRLVAKYPTVALGVFDRMDFEAVGTFDGRRNVLVSVSNAEMLEAWSGEPIAAIFSNHLPTGRFSWAEITRGPLTEEVLKSARPFGPLAMSSWWRLKSGQVLKYTQLDQSCEIFNHDSPGLRGQLEAHKVAREVIESICGEAVEMQGGFRP